MTETNSGAIAPVPGVPAAAERLVAGHFRLLRELGRGGMGVVWLARDELLDREVAVKELRPPDGLAEASFAELRERAMREARNAARIRHASAVTLYHVIPPNAGDDALYLIMEFIDGPTLAELIERHGPLPAPWVGALGLQLLDVLQEAHAMGIVHRDVKPANIMVTRDGQVKLTDFGIAHSASDPRLTSFGVTGTPAYLAPELFDYAPIAPAADLWSLGATLYHAAVGRAPFGQDDLAAMRYAILFEELPVPDCDPDLAAAIGAMLCRDPAERATIEQARALLSPYGAPRLPPLAAPQPQPDAGAAQSTAAPARGGATVRPPSVPAQEGAPPDLPPPVPAPETAPPEAPAAQAPAPAVPMPAVPVPAVPVAVPAVQPSPGGRLSGGRLMTVVAAVVVVMAAVGVPLGVLAVRAHDRSPQGARSPSGQATSTSALAPGAGLTAVASPSSPPATSHSAAPRGSSSASAPASRPAGAVSSSPAPAPSSTPASSLVPPPAPAIIAVGPDASGGDLDVTWGALADSGLSYYVHYEDLSIAQPTWKSVLTSTTTSTVPGCSPTMAQAGICTQTTAQLSGLPAGDTFAIYVTAANAAGQGQPSATHYYVGPPLDFAAVDRSGVVDLSWVTVSGNSVVIYYLDETAADDTWQTLDCAETTTTCKFPYPTDSTQAADLTVGGRYVFYAQSENKYGAGQSSQVTVDLEA